MDASYLESVSFSVIILRAKISGSFDLPLQKPFWLS